MDACGKTVSGSVESDGVPVSDAGAVVANVAMVAGGNVTGGGSVMAIDN